MGEIKKATDINLPSELNVMLYGEFASGKTTFATTFPKPLLFFDTDLRHQTYQGVEGIDYIPYKETGTRPREYQSFMKDLKKYQEEGEYKTVVLDSITTLFKLIKFDILGRVGTGSSASEGLTLPQWGQVTERFEEIFDILRGYDKHTVIVSHEQLIQDELSGEIKTLVMMIGKKFPQRAPLYIDEIYYCHTAKDRETRELQYLARTRSDRSHPARTSLNLRDKNERVIPILDEVEPQNFNVIMDKVKEARDNPEKYIKKVKKERSE